MPNQVSERKAIEDAFSDCLQKEFAALFGTMANQAGGAGDFKGDPGERFEVGLQILREAREKALRLIEDNP